MSCLLTSYRSYNGDPQCSRFDVYIPIVGNHILAGLDIQYDDVRAQLPFLLCFEESKVAVIFPETCNTCDMNEATSLSPTVTPSQDPSLSPTASSAILCDDTDGDLLLR